VKFKKEKTCDRMCEVMVKACIRSWMATGNNLLNAIDINEGMRYAADIKNRKVAMAEMMSAAGAHLSIPKGLGSRNTVPRSLGSNQCA
jgi:hypothetical protein